MRCLLKKKSMVLPALMMVLTLCIVNCAGVLISPLTVFAGETLPEESKENGENVSNGKKFQHNATIHFITGASSAGYTEIIYEYASNDPLLVMYNRGSEYDLYLKSYGSGKVSFYTFSDDGVTAVNPKVTYTKQIKHDLSTGETTETEYNIIQSLGSLSYYGSSSVYIEGKYQTLAYSSSRLVEGKTIAVGVTEEQMAYYYLKHKETVRSWRAFSFDFTSRAVFDYAGSFSNYDIDLMDVVLQDGVLTHGGTIYSDEDVYRGGIQVQFCYYSEDGRRSFNPYYNYYLPLGAESYELNFADVQTLSVDDCTYILNRIYLRPVVQYNYFSPIMFGDAVLFSAEELEEAGCFKKGGNPIVVIGSSDNTDESDDGYGGDPSEKDNSDDGTMGGGSFREPDEPEWDDTEHGFWDNTLHYLSYFAKSVYSIVLSLIDFPDYMSNMLSSSNSLSDFISNLTEDRSSFFLGLFVPEEGFTDKYKETFNNSFPVVESSKQFMNDFVKRLETFGNTAPSITVPFSKIWQSRAAMYDVEMSFAWFEPYRNNFHTLLSGIMWAVFCFRQYLGIKNLLNATGGVVSLFGGAD